MLDSDVALLYQYETKYINLAVKRNKNRFLENFCFQLTENEIKNMRLQNATRFKEDFFKYRGKIFAYVFTE